VFLDEIDKTTLEFQAKLLHVLDSREVRPVGSTRAVPVEARILCATNRNLEALVANGRFLDDLHHRLLGGAIEVPPLRDRGEDLPLLAGIVLDEICSLERSARPQLDDEAWQVLAAHAWPGNVRELKTLLHRAVALHRGATTLTAAMILASAPAGPRCAAGRTVAAQGLTHRLARPARQILARSKANRIRRRAAEILGISCGLGKKMVRLGIERPGTIAADRSLGSKLSRRGSCTILSTCAAIFSRPPASGPELRHTLRLTGRVANDVGKCGSSVEFCASPAASSLAQVDLVDLRHPLVRMSFFRRAAPASSPAGSTSSSCR
jgi:hypothetical protein